MTGFVLGRVKDTEPRPATREGHGSDSVATACEWPTRFALPPADKGPAAAVHGASTVGPSTPPRGDDAMRLRRSLLGVLIGLSAISAGLVVPTATLAAATSTPTAASTATACTDGHWPLAVQGVPSLWHAGAAAGDYLWHDANGWHLRVTHRGTTRFVFTGRVVSSAPITATPVRLE